ncbi:TPA: hypothetical protein N0F65_004155 [Lagenidium giganteum]|uniref:Uncharacterized protein n=1 Tax=Lagenidium giganteum TaxID=4803 RepID=A0AAV2ZF61_9STRA|nr:TPA: hypothetical protein N0F65_004155 [Lagenidium giganteum]
MQRWCLHSTKPTVASFQRRLRCIKRFVRDVLLSQSRHPVQTSVISAQYTRTSCKRHPRPIPWSSSASTPRARAMRYGTLGSFCFAWSLSVVFFCAVVNSFVLRIQPSKWTSIEATTKSRVSKGRALELWKAVQATTPPRRR